MLVWVQELAMRFDVLLIGSTPWPMVDRAEGVNGVAT